MLREYRHIKDYERELCCKQIWVYKKTNGNEFEIIQLHFRLV